MSDINFADLFPERLTIVNLPGGGAMTLINRDEMGVEDFAEFQRLQRRMQKLTDAAKTPNNQNVAMKTAQEMDAAMDEGLKRLAAGELTDETLAQLKLGQKAAIIKRWGEHQGEIIPKNA